jgi:hypothetical protein
MARFSIIPPTVLLTEVIIMYQMDTTPLNLPVETIE